MADFTVGTMSDLIGFEGYTHLTYSILPHLSHFLLQVLEHQHTF
jgi:hypothetical protein